MLHPKISFKSFRVRSNLKAHKAEESSSESIPRASEPREPEITVLTFISLDMAPRRFYITAALLVDKTVRPRSFTFKGKINGSWVQKKPSVLHPKVSFKTFRVRSSFKAHKAEESS